MIYARNEIHKYKYIIGVIDIYSRRVACRAMTNMRMLTIMDDLKDIVRMTLVAIQKISTVIMSLTTRNSLIILPLKEHDFGSLLLTSLIRTQSLNASGAHSLRYWKE